MTCEAKTWGDVAMKFFQDMMSAFGRMFAPRDDFKAQLMADLGIKR